jgi:hypothetical protein
MALKLLVDPYTDAIIGPQGVGPKGVDKRINVITTAMTGHVMASDLAQLELAYAPPFGSAKDPVNMLGFADENLHTATSLTHQWHQLAQAQDSVAVLLDVHSPAEFAAGAIPGAINMPVDELRQRIDEVRELAPATSCRALSCRCARPCGVPDPGRARHPCPQLGRGLQDLDRRNPRLDESASTTHVTGRARGWPPAMLVATPGALVVQMAMDKWDTAAASSVSASAAAICATRSA